VSLDPDDGHDPALSASGRALLDAVVAIGSDLDLHAVLDRIVRSACTLAGARYGALGVLGGDGLLSDFITHGISEQQRDRIGDLPRGRGILGLLIDHPDPLRLTDLAEHPRSVGFPEHHPPMRTFLGLPVRVRGTVFGNLYLTEKQGGRLFTTQDEMLVGALASAAGFVIENARSYTHSEQQRRWLAATARLADLLQPPLELAEALGQVAIAARSALGSNDLVGVAVLRDGAPGIAAVDGRDPDGLGSVVGELDRAVRAAIVEGTVSSPRTAAGRQVYVAPILTHLSEPSALVAMPSAAPLQTQEAAEVRELVTSFATQAALALDRIQAVQDREELAVVGDRDRIARDLHDVVIQRLFATGLQLQGVRAKAGAGVVQQRLDQAVVDLDETIRDIRSTIFELQHQDAGSGVRRRVAELAAEYAGLLGFVPLVRTQGPVDTAVGETVAEQLLAVLREALSNAARHAAATTVSVLLEASADAASLTVTDDGRGLPAGRHESGLANLRRRAADLGGEVSVTGAEGGGTVLVWRVPLR
jgi:signal transduction histidine kinase